MLFSKTISTARAIAATPLALPAISPRRLSLADIEGRDSVFADPRVRNAARDLLAAAEKVPHAYRACIEAAIQQRGTDSGEVIATLGQWAADVRARGAEVTDVFADLDAQHRARRAAMEPLKIAVSQEAHRLTTWQESVVRAIHTTRPAGPGSAPEIRMQHLVAAGLTPAQLDLLREPCSDSFESRKAAMQAETCEIAAKLAPLQAFMKTGDVAHLAGLGYGVLIEKQHAALAALESGT